MAAVLGADSAAAATAPASRLEAEHLRKSYGPRVVVKDVHQIGRAHV